MTTERLAERRNKNTFTYFISKEAKPEELYETLLIRLAVHQKLSSL